MKNRDKKMLCTAFGHRTPQYAGGPGYGDVIGGAVDGIGRSHWMVEYQCARCGRSFIAARFHGPVAHNLQKAADEKGVS